MIEIYLDSHIRIKDINPSWREGLAKLCSVKNEDKEVALKEEIWGAEKLDDLFTLAELEGNILILPRGFLHELCDLLREHDHDFKIIDAMKYEILPQRLANKLPKLRDKQSGALVSMLTHDQGRIIAPPGTGKTVIALAAIVELNVPTLIIVDKKHIAQQWVDRAKEHCDLDIGFIGDDRWEEQSVTVATIQTLWSKRNNLDYPDWNNAAWWDKWSMVILDEQHHIPAETFAQILQKFPARKRFGLSATVGKTPAKKRISELIFGQILHETKEVIMKPKIEVIDTKFDFSFQPTKRIGNKVVRNNYTKMIAALVRDKDRNDLIAKNLLANSDHCNLVVSDRLNHLRELYTLVEGGNFRCFSLTGKESLDERMTIYDLADEGRCIIFSTVASEALDIPRIDRIHMIYPRKNIEAVWQMIGRGTRPHKNKNDIIVYDYVDSFVPVLYSQYKNRLKLYRRESLGVTRLYRNDKVPFSV